MQADLASLRALMRALPDTPSRNPVFPHPAFFARSFETRQVGFLYDRVMGQADDLALAQLVRLAQATDNPQRADAQSALAFVHFALGDAAHTQRGLEHIQAALKGLNNYPSAVFWGRSLAWGGPYSDKDLKVAMNFLAAAGRMPDQRREQKAPMDPLNTEAVHTATLEHLLQNEPDMPYRSNYMPLLEQVRPMRQLQDAFKLQFQRSDAFKPVDQVLGEFKTWLSRNAPPFAAAPSLPKQWTGWQGLSELMAYQEQWARRLHAGTEPRAQVKVWLGSVDALNGKLQAALSATERSLVFQLMQSTEPFPENVKPMTALQAVQSGVARSCSLSQTWRGQ